MQICATKNEKLDAGFQDLRGLFAFHPRSSAFIRVPLPSQQTASVADLLTKTSANE